MIIRAWGQRTNMGRPTRYSTVSVSIFVGLYLAEFVYCELKLKLNSFTLCQSTGRLHRTSC
jgi:hypothetical protein